VQQVIGESLVLIGEQWNRLWGSGLTAGSLKVRSRYGESDGGCFYYEPGVDFEVDEAGGRIRRLSGSRIPDYRSHVHYGQDDFNHANVPRFDNLEFFVYADYLAEILPDPWTGQTVIRSLSEGLGAPDSGLPLRILVYGDSISTGCDASCPERMYFHRLAAWLSDRTGAPVSIHNVALGGETSRGGLKRYDSIDFHDSYDLAILAYAMNDASCPGGDRLNNNVPPDEYQDNMTELARRVRDRFGAEIILLSTLVPNRRWRHVASRAEADLPEYCAVLEDLARRESYSYVDIYGVWQGFLARKQPEDLLANNVNHPGDFGHWIYEQCIRSIFVKSRNREG